MHDMETLTRRVRDAGGKMTSQRTLIYRALDHDTSHPTAEELYARLLPHLPHLSLTTVYKTLNELVAWGEVRRIDVGDGRMRFDPDVREHAEVVCLSCHRVVDAPGGAAPLPAEMAGYSIVRRADTYFGYCPHCREANHP